MARICAVLFLILALGNLFSSAEARAFFVFGDSLVDNGNNNYLVTTARADAPPYGIDYPSHRPTGRFSNGLNIPDIISNVFLFCFSLKICAWLCFDCGTGFRLCMHCMEVMWPCCDFFIELKVHISPSLFEPNIHAYANLRVSLWYFLLCRPF